MVYHLRYSLQRSNDAVVAGEDEDDWVRRDPPEILHSQGSRHRLLHCRVEAQRKEG